MRYTTSRCMATRTALFSGAHGLGLPTIAQPRKPLLVKTEDWSSPPLAPRLRRVPLKGNPSLTRSKEGTSAARRAARAPYRTVTHAVTGDIAHRFVDYIRFKSFYSLSLNFHRNRVRDASSKK